MKFTCDGHDYTVIQDHNFQFRVLNNYQRVVAYATASFTQVNVWELTIVNEDKTESEPVAATNISISTFEKTDLDCFKQLEIWAVYNYVAWATNKNTVENHVA